MVSGDQRSGWYQDPSGQPDLMRWWDGAEWTDEVRSSVAFPDADRPVPPPVTTVEFRTVDSNRTRKRVVAVAVAAVVAMAAGVGGYLIGDSGDRGKEPAAAGGTTGAGAAASSAPGSAGPTVAAGGPISGTPGVSASATPDPAGLEGFFGTPLVGGKPLPGGQRIVGPNQKMTFTIPTGWSAQADPKATSPEARYVLSPYACPGRAGNACGKALVVHNLRLLTGGWSALDTLTVGMGHELVKAQTNGAKALEWLSPVKQKALKLQGLDGYLALWDIPAVAGQNTPATYCGVLTVKTAPTTTEVAVLQICVERTSDAPPVTLFDDIANSVEIKV